MNAISLELKKNGCNAAGPQLFSRLPSCNVYVSGHSLKCISQSSFSAKVIVTCLFKLDFSGFVFDRTMVTKLCFNIG